MDCPDAIMGPEESETGSKDGGSKEAENLANAEKETSSGVLRTVVLPGDLISKFLEVARVNSDKNIETLGTLGGQLCNNKFRVTHLLIPKQTGHPDSCTMDDGIEDVFEFYERENIIFLGWIHTHPDYSVFLSSVDMHNQYERQRMLPEVSFQLFPDR